MPKPMTRAERAAAFLKDIAGPEGLESLRVDAAGAEEMAEARARQTEGSAIEAMALPLSRTAINGAVEAVMADRPLAPDQASTIEAIIIPDKRPAMPLRGGTYTARHKLWLHLNDETVKARLTGAARAIGRIEVPGSKYPYGGTGFVVGPGLVMTNRHVAEIFITGVGARWLAPVAGVTPGYSSAFAPDNAESEPLKVTGVIMVHPYWDMALLKVEGLPPDVEALTLCGADVTGFERSEIAVIGYPGFDPRNDIDVQRTVYDNRFGIKQLQPGHLRERWDTESYSRIVSAATHDCSTLGGTSGSALIHIATGKVLGLHFGGEYLARNYAVPASELAADGRVFDAGVRFDSEKPAGLPAWAGFWTRAESGEAPRAPARGSRAETDMTGEAGAAAQVPATGPGGSSGAVEITVPLHITIRLGSSAGPAVAAVAAAPGSAVERLAEPRHDRDYGNRTGYDEMFLGLSVPFPAAADPAVLAPARTGGARLDYQNFSLVMHKGRRLALATAANVTAETALKEPVGGADTSRRALGGLGPNDQEKWFLDPRMDEAYQLPDAFYTRDDGAFDKGHIVRREDVAWGRTMADLARANGDTFHVTNCSPQVAPFNRSTLGRRNWGDLEAVVLRHAGSERLCVLAGPVLEAADPRFLGAFGRGDRRVVQIPVKFWKVVVARAAVGLAAFGFLLEQDLSAVQTTEFAVPDEFRPCLLPIARIAALTGLVFADAVIEADQFTGRGREIAFQAGIGVQPARRG